MKPVHYLPCAMREWREEGLWRNHDDNYAHGPWWCENCGGFIESTATRATDHIATEEHKKNTLLLRLAR